MDNCLIYFWVLVLVHKRRMVPFCLHHRVAAGRLACRATPIIATCSQFSLLLFHDAVCQDMFRSTA